MRRSASQSPAWCSPSWALGAPATRSPCASGCSPTAPGCSRSRASCRSQQSSLPLVERGAQVAEGGIVAGVEGASVAGRDVELLPACTEFTYVHRLVAATRRLVEEEHADIVIGPIGSPDGIVFRSLAEKYPAVTFLHGVSGGPGSDASSCARQPVPVHARRRTGDRRSRCPCVSRPRLADSGRGR